MEHYKPLCANYVWILSWQNSRQHPVSNMQQNIVNFGAIKITKSPRIWMLSLKACPIASMKLLVSCNLTPQLSAPTTNHAAKYSNFWGFQWHLWGHVHLIWLPPPRIPIGSSIFDTTGLPLFPNLIGICFYSQNIPTFTIQQFPTQSHNP